MWGIWHAQVIDPPTLAGNCSAPYYKCLVAHALASFFQDSFYKALTEQQRADVVNYNFDHPDAMDHDALINVVQELREVGPRPLRKRFQGTPEFVHRHSAAGGQGRQSGRPTARGSAGDMGGGGDQGEEGCHGNPQELGRSEVGWCWEKGSNDRDHHFHWRPSLRS